MALSIVQAVGKIKADCGPLVSAEIISSICKKLDHEWRKRVLDPVAIIRVAIVQILYGNIACAGAVRQAGVSCTGEAYRQARQHLPLSVFSELLHNVVATLQGVAAGVGLWHGHRTFIIDGTSVSMPDTPELQKEFGQPGGQAKGCGFPVMHVLAMFHAATGFLLKVVPSKCRTHDMSKVGEVHPELRENDVLVGDRAFCSFAHLALLFTAKVFGVFRVHQQQIVDFRPRRPHKSRGAQTKKVTRREKGWPTSRWLKRLGKNDQLVEYVKPKKKPDWLTDERYAALPEVLVVRELRYAITLPGRRTRAVTVATTLLDAVKYSAADVAALYGQRWQIELNFRHLKTTLKMDVLRCEKVDGVLKELTTYALVYNLVRMVMLAAAQRQKVDPARISFVDAARWLATAGTANAILKLIVNPLRPERFEPRVRKRRPKQYPLMRKPRSELKKTLEKQREVA